jgi:Na+/melibiose symporter-like transporter
MKLQHLFTINFVIAIFFGVSCSVFPGWVLQMYGLVPDDGAIWTTRLVGGSILGFATLMWFGRKVASIDARRAIAFALLVQDAIGFVASMEIQLSGSVNMIGWSSPILYGLLALSYAYFLFISPGAS